MQYKDAASNEKLHTQTKNNTQWDGCIITIDENRVCLKLWEDNLFSKKQSNIVTEYHSDLQI